MDWSDCMSENKKKLKPYYDGKRIVYPWATPEEQEAFEYLDKNNPLLSDYFEKDESEGDSVNDLIKNYIAYPFAVTVFKQDKGKFREFKLGNLYLDMLDSILERMHQDYYKVKAELLSKHHIDVQHLEIGKYKINGEIVEFSPEELKQMTNQLMSDYLYGDKAQEFERQERVWKPED